MAAPIFTAVNPRFQASILFAGHLHAHQMDDPPEVIPLHFAPRSKVPVVLINGTRDFISPVKTSLEPMLAFQGAPDEDKKLVLLKGRSYPTSQRRHTRVAGLAGSLPGPSGTVALHALRGRYGGEVFHVCLGGPVGP